MTSPTSDTNNDEAARLGIGAAPVAESPAAVTPALPNQPSHLYGPTLWRAGLLAARFCPEAAVRNLAATLASVYRRACPRRRQVVLENILPVVGDAALAGKATTALFRNFALKLVDLWRFEAGLPIDHLFLELEGRRHYVNAIEAGRGVLLVTPHLGNWEFGAPLMASHGYKLHVITLVEPGHGLTEMRQQARARWGIETLVIGRDPFAFVEIIRRLEAGATVALLVDRPPKTSGVEVQLFGKPFMASIAVAELARATGCALVPVHLTRVEKGYAAKILPSVPYERATLRDRGARQRLTQEVMNVFAPAIREHVDQWYHFVPVWNRGTQNEK